VEGAVSSSTRMLKLNVDTITTNASSIHLNSLTKNKAPDCYSPVICPFQNKKLCHYKQLPQYQLPVSAPSPYRYYPGTVFSSNHFAQSPNTFSQL
jgi:hypothetical protein